MASVASVSATSKTSCQDQTKSNSWSQQSVVSGGGEEKQSVVESIRKESQTNGASHYEETPLLEEEEADQTHEIKIVNDRGEETSIQLANRFSICSNKGK